ncbi:MAG: M1 family metallopeptidase [Bacteroidota bacterium]
MRKTVFLLLALFAAGWVHAQEEDNWGRKFEQLDAELPTPNRYRTGSGAPGPDYWQQKADYVIQAELNDDNQSLTGTETITYYNYAPEPLEYLWVQLDQNVRSQNSMTRATKTGRVPDSIPAKFFKPFVTNGYNFDGGFKIKSVKQAGGNTLPTTIVNTMMKVKMPKPLNTGESFSFEIAWSYNINDRMEMGGRSGYEYFPKDGNYLYTIAQWFPRMAVYDDVNGWQNKQFLGSGEFALPFGDYDVKITVPADHVVASTGVLQNPKQVLSKTQMQRFDQAKSSFDKPVIIVTEEEAIEAEKSKSKKKSTWHYKASNVRDFAFASSRKFIWDAQSVDINGKKPLAMSYYPKEGNPLWEEESTKAVVNTLIHYSKQTVEYPYPVAISVHAASIGMEYPMICFNFGRPNENGEYSVQKKMGMIGVIVHEVGHNFFPMIINSDERQWAWMDEGLNTFLEGQTMRKYYPDLPYTRGDPDRITGYMKGDKRFIRPIMTNPEQVTQLGPNAYTKPATALNILRETIMGEELFDEAFRTYSQRWAFKHPKPADFFRSMEDASAFDLDWFWNGWFYSRDYVDIAVDEVKWYQIKNEEQGVEKTINVAKGDIGKKDKDDKNTDFSDGPKEFKLLDTPGQFYSEYRARLNDDEIRAEFAGKHLYQVTFTNEGGLVTPIIVEFTYKDGTKDQEFVPAEIWRKNEKKVSKVFVKEKEVTSIVIDPDKKLADSDAGNNFFPKAESKSKFDQFKEGDGE